MRERALIAQLAEVKAIQTAQRAGAYTAFVEAKHTERRCDADQRKTASEIGDTLNAWESTLGAHHLNPDLVGAFANALHDLDGHLRAAIERQTAAHAHATEKQSELERCDKRMEGTGHRLRRIRRKLAQSIEDKALAALELRVTYAWTCR